MAYNAAKNKHFMQSSNVGQRRGPPRKQLGSNFIPGGQLLQPNNPASNVAKSQGPRQNAKQSEQQGVQQSNMRQQAQHFLNQQHSQTPLPKQNEQMSQPEILKVQASLNEVKMENAPPAKAEEVKMDTALSGNEGELKAKTNFVKGGKINKHERLRRRNQRLRKYFQPKNALMVLNELVGNAQCSLSETPDLYDGTLFRCVILVDGVEHCGHGKSKPTAKTAAAEAALKHMVLSKMKNSEAEPAVVTNNDSSPFSLSKMETDDDNNLRGIPWSHIASFAIHKLLSSWDEGSNFVEKLSMVTPSVSSSDLSKSLEKKPAKKIPETAATMNPIMLLNQMYPTAIYEEISKVGNPPQVLFKTKCTVGEYSFIGTGPTKKGAKKMCAFAACQKILGVQYSSQFLEEHNFTDSSVTVVSVSSSLLPF